MDQENQNNNPNENSVPQSTPPNFQSQDNSSLHSVQQSPQQTQPKKSNRKTLFIFVTIIIILIFVGSILAAVLLKSKPKVVTVNHDVPLIRLGDFDGSIPKYPIQILNQNVDLGIVSQMFEGLTGFKNEYTTIPLLAKSWKSLDANTWEFKIRQNVKFNDGNLMTANDVKVSIDYAVAHQNDDNGNSAFIAATSISKVQVVNNNTVRVITSVPDALLLDQLSIIGIFDSKARLGSYMAGTGPYYLKPGTKPTETSIDLVASTQYWQGHVNTKELKIKIYPDLDTMINDVNNNKLDVAGDFYVSQFKKIIPQKTFSVTDLGLNYLGINTNNVNSPVHTLAVRQAIADALNIPLIIKTAGLYAEQTSQIVPITLPGHNEKIVNSTFSPSQAKQLLVGVKNVQKQIILAYPGGDDVQANEMAKELNSVGLNVKPMLVQDFNTFISNLLDGKYDMYYISDTTISVDGLPLLQDLLLNNKDYNNPKVESLLNEANGTLDTSTRIKDMKDVATIVNDDKPIIPLYTQNRRYYIKKQYNATGDMPSYSNSVYFWKVTKN